MDVPARFENRLGQGFVVDTNIVDDPAPATAELKRLHETGWIDLRRTDTLDEELNTRQDPEHRDELLAASEPYVEHQGPVVLDQSRLDHSVWGSEGDAEHLDEVYGLLFPGSDRHDLSTPRAHRKLRDARHVATAIRYAADAFITRDERDLVRKADATRDRFGLWICTPEGALAFVERLRRRHEHRTGTNDG